MEGYNIAVKIGGKTIIGRTQDDLDISANVKTSLTKDDAGVTQKKVTGHTITGTMSAISEVTAGSTTQLSREECLDMVLATDTTYAITYQAGTGAVYSGTIIFTKFSESSDAAADNDASFSLGYEVIGGLTKAA